ncbi:hypothetical protein RQP46_008855 [Phenoliferia psychrophenolica]
MLTRCTHAFAATPISTPISSPLVSITLPPTSIIPTSVIPKTSSTLSSTSTPVSVVTVYTTFLNSDGSTVTSSSVQASAAPDSKSSSSSNTGQTWGIVGGVVGGVALFAGLLFVIWRFTQRRFSDIDDGADDIKWPELQPDGQTAAAGTSTLNPMGTRRTGGAGIEMDGDVSMGEYDAEMNGGAGSMYYSQEHATGSYEQVGVYGNQNAPGGAYYDPYLGPSAAPQPAPQNIYPPQNRPYSPYNNYQRSNSTDEIPMGPMNPSSPRGGSPRSGSPRIGS